ncbi:MAG: hypothetical protein PHN88_04360 [Ignavibacteria bacterium]|nr:hypothetical protein [Ignavibacteria bacterium]
MNETIRIADEIYDKRIEDNNGIYWKTMSLNSQTNAIEWTVSENIYSGVSGIILFYLYLYKINQNEKYLKICKQSMNWVVNYCRENKTVNYSFFTGRMSVPYTLLKMNNLYGKDYIETALEIGDQCDIFITSNNPPREFLNGAAGTLISLLHLYDGTKDSGVLEKIDLYVKYIIDNARYNKSGIHWDRSINVIKSLCGITHGAAGIGLAFLELGHYFDNTAYYYLAEQAFAYESNYYGEKQKNWMDLRKGIYSTEDENKHKSAFLEKRYSFFSEPISMYAWCHGAPGIGFTRLRAYELLKKEIYKIEMNKCEDAVLSQIEAPIFEGTSLTLCHGLGGNLDLINEIPNILWSKDTKSRYEVIIKRLCRFIQDKKYYTSGLASYSGKMEDLSLFMGNAGIGYYFLRLLDEKKESSILSPVIKENLANNESTSKFFFSKLNLSELRRIEICKVFKNTVKLISVFEIQKFNEYLNLDSSNFRNNEIEDFRLFFKNLELKDKKKAEMLNDVYEYETNIYTLDSNIESYSLANARKLFGQGIILELINDEDKLKKTALSINHDAMALTSKWNWEKIEEWNLNNLMHLHKENTRKVIIASHTGIEITEISDFCYHTISLFNEERTTEEALVILSELFDNDNEEQKKIIRDNGLLQIKNLLSKGFLIP